MNIDAKAQTGLIQCIHRLHTGVMQCIQIQKAHNQEVQVTVGGNLSPKSNFRAWVWPIQETGQSRKLANGGTDVLAFDDRSRQSHIVGRTQVLPSAPTHFFMQV